MARLNKGEANNAANPVLSFVFETTLGGVLTPTGVRWKVFRKTTPMTRVFPTSGWATAYEQVARVDAFIEYAPLYTPAEDLVDGAHVMWFEMRATANHPWRYATQDFEVGGVGGVVYVPQTSGSLRAKLAGTGAFRAKISK